eukprot:6197905-Pleurochrysis_carterae.AAC.2
MCVQDTWRQMRPKRVKSGLEIFLPKVAVASKVRWGSRAWALEQLEQHLLNLVGAEHILQSRRIVKP